MTSKNSDALDYIVTDENGDKYLKSAGHPKQHAKKGGENDYHPAEWVKYAIYIWMFRLGISTLGSLVPVFMAYFSILTYNLSHSVDLTPSSYGHFSTLNYTTLDWHTSQSSDALFTALKSSILPVKVVNIPVISRAAVKLLLKSLYLSHTVRLKVQRNDSHFIYYDNHRLWSSTFESLKKYEYIDLESYRTTCKDSKYQYLDCVTKNRHNNIPANDDTDNLNQSYLYASYPDLLPYLEVFLPHILPAFSAAAVQVSDAQLWLNSQGVEAALHYDEQDNVLFQLSGEKKIFIVDERDAGHLLTYPSYHPYHRQAHYYIHNNKSIDQINNTSTCAATVCDPLEISHYYINDLLKFGIKSYEISLKEGEAVYIPRGYLHSISTSSADSLSVNTWLSSAIYTEFINKLRSLALPFKHSFTTRARWARLGAVARGVSRVLHSSSVVILRDREEENDVNHLLARSMLERIQASVIEYESVMKINVQYKKDLFCNREENLQAEMDSHSRRAALSLSNTAVYYLPMLSWRVIKFSLVDFLEESILAAVRYSEDEDRYEGHDDVLEGKEDVEDLTPAYVKNILEYCFLL